MRANARPSTRMRAAAACLLAAPAHQLADTEPVQDQFELLADAPAGSPDVTGQAWLARTDDGHTLSVDLAGLEPGAE